MSFFLSKKIRFKSLEQSSVTLFWPLVMTIKANSLSTFILHGLPRMLLASLLAEWHGHRSAASILPNYFLCPLTYKTVISEIKEDREDIEKNVPHSSRQQFFKVNKHLTADHDLVSEVSYCRLREWCLQGTVCCNRMSLLFSQSQITVNGNSGGAVSPMSYYQRPFSPSAYSLPGSLNSSIIMQHGRSLGESFDSCDFHDDFNTASTNHVGEC